VIIRRLRADFGVLEGAELELHEGLNIIQTPNESGKSTWCAFVRTMLYGMDTARRRRGELPDKLRYAPWSGALPGGSMDLISAGREITLSRTTVNPAAPMRGFSAVYTGTGLPVSGLTEADAGELLTGVTAPVFRRTAFISSGEMGISASVELEKKITALVSAGEPDAASFSEAAEKLRRWERKCRFRGQGRLPELEREEASLLARIEEVRATEQELDRAEITADKARLLVRSLRETPEKNNGAADALRREQDRLAQERQILDREREAEAIRAALRQGPFRGRTPDEAMRQRAEADARRGAKLLKRREQPLPPGWVGAALLTVAALSGVWGLMQQPILLALAAALALGGVLSLLDRNARLRRNEQADRELAALLRKYGVAQPGEIPGIWDEYQERWREAEALSAAAEELRASLPPALTAPEGAEGKDRQENAPGREAEERLARASQNAARLRGRLDTLEDPAILAGELDRVRRERELWTRREQALAMALETLTQADEEMQLRFAPALTRQASEILRRLTGGSSDTLALGRDLSASVGKKDALHESAYLSRGALDQTYLALRLALCRLLLGGPDPCPILLDDALLSFDDQRMGLALDVLSDMARERQIILFTCQKREKEYLKSRAAE